jgi:hypothetical protein
MLQARRSITGIPGVTIALSAGGRILSSRYGAGIMLAVNEGFSLYLDKVSV